MTRPDDRARGEIIRLSHACPSIRGLPLIDLLDTLVFTLRFPRSGCGPSCADVCCSGGATMDILAFDKFLAHRNAWAFERIRWDGFDFRDDIYSPGGKG